MGAHSKALGILVRILGPESTTGEFYFIKVGYMVFYRGTVAPTGAIFPFRPLNELSPLVAIEQSL